MSSRPKVLLVDDRAENLLALEAQLRGLEAEILEATSGRRALDLLLQHEVAVTIVDVQMPEMDGFELAELMRGSPRTSAIPIIFVTAGLHDQSRVFKGYEAGAVDFLVKPIDARILANKVAVFLALHRQRRQLASRVSELQTAEAALRRAKELSEALNRIGDAVHGSLDIGEVIRRVVLEGMRALGSDSGAFSERVPDGWKVVCAIGMPDTVVGSVMDEDGQRHALLALQRRQPVADTDGFGEERVSGDHLRRAGVRSVLTVPLLHSGTALGVMFFNYRAGQRAFEPAELDFARQLGVTASIALQNARLFAERTAAEERLLEADRRKNEFMATLSHELRNPLAPIRNSLYILDHTAPGSDQARRAKDVVNRQVDQLARLVDDLLDVTRVTRNKIRLRRQKLELGELVLQAAEDHRGEFEEAGVRLEVRPAGMPVWVNADGSRLAQAVGNLLQNAVKFTPRDAAVTTSVSVDAEQRRAVIRVADTGVGMKPEVLGQLFQPFIQAETTLERTKGGLGLGLALVKGIVELHGGSVQASSAGLGRGAEFTIRLPLEPGSPAPEQGPAARTPALRQRILVIEDNADAADSLREVLEFDQHEVGVACDGPSGVALARELRPGIILCDIGLPGMDGFEVARAVRAMPELEGVQLVALSGYALPEDLERARQAGFDHHLAKPPSLEQLKEILAGHPARERAAPAGMGGRHR